MFARYLSLKQSICKNLTKRTYWVAPVEPTHDIVNTIIRCQKYQLTYLVKSPYTNHAIGTSIDMTIAQITNCSNFQQIKSQLEDEKYILSVCKDTTIGHNMYGIKFDEFNKHIYIHI